MTNRPLLAVAVSLALVAMASPAAADHFGDADRDAIYIGASTIDHGLNEYWTPACESVFGEGDCPTPIASGIIWAACDDGEFIEGGGFQAFGGALFCAVPASATVGVAIHDPLVDPVAGFVTCMAQQDDITWHVRMGSIEGSGTFNIQADCPHEPVHHSDDPEGTTRVGVYIEYPPGGTGGTTGEITLNFV